MVFGTRLHMWCCWAFVSFMKISAWNVELFTGLWMKLCSGLFSVTVLYFDVKNTLLIPVYYTTEYVHSLWLCYIMPFAKPCSIFLIHPSAKWGEAPPEIQVVTACEVFGHVWHLRSTDGWIVNAGVVMIALRKSCFITASTATNNWLCHWNCFCFVLLICDITCNLHVHPVCHIKIL